MENVTVMKKPILVVGAGFSGAVCARELAEGCDANVVVIDQRDHIAGNCHTTRDEATDVMQHVYGPHIFNTSNTKVWDYVRRFGEFRPFVNRVKASTSRGVFSLPINLHTINQFFGTKLGPKEAQAFIASKAEASIQEPQNFEEQALKFIGRDLYDAFFRGYTKKQWGCDPTELPASILKRLPVRFNYDDNYYNSSYQGIPADGYTEVIRRILEHPRVNVRLATPWDPAMAREFAHVIYTGPIDAYYGHRFGELGYRTVFWDKATHSGDFQGNAVINYTELAQPFTRVHEHKHFAPWESHERTIVFTEYSKETEDGDIPYYPKRLANDKCILKAYRDHAAHELNVSFLGRLATYRYMDMHHVIGEALDFSNAFRRAIAEKSRIPVFPNTEDPAT
jgi:UDP-galactopyranose mutase